MPELSVALDIEKLEEAVEAAAAEALKRFLTPPEYRGQDRPGWTEVEGRVRSVVREVLAVRDLRPLVEAAVDRLAPAVVEVEVQAAVAKAARRALTDRPGLVLERVREVLK